MLKTQTIIHRTTHHHHHYLNMMNADNSTANVNDDHPANIDDNPPANVDDGHPTNVDDNPPATWQAAIHNSANRPR